MRHTIKPVGYVRYGDDFVVFVPNKARALAVQYIATAWLLDNLKLRIHAKNNVVVKASHGLRFLGHGIYPNAPLSVDAFMTNKLKQSIDPRNMSSYGAMALARRQRKQLPWLLLGKLLG